MAASSVCPFAKMSGAIAVSRPVSRSDNRMLRRSSSFIVVLQISGYFRHATAAEEYRHRFGYCNDAFLEFISTSEHRHFDREFLVHLYVTGPEHDSVREGIKVMQVAELERLDPHPAPAVQGRGHPDQPFRIGRDRLVRKGGTGEEPLFELPLLLFNDVAKYTAG